MSNTANVLIAPNGGGKSTQIKKLAASGYVPVCMSEVLHAREIIDQTFAQISIDAKTEGHLVPFDMTMETLHNHLMTFPEGTDFVFDGIPRDPQQAQWLLTWLHVRDYNDVTYFVFENLTPEHCFRRIKHRVQKMIAHGEKPRPDDLKDEVVKRRLHTYFANAPAIVDFLELAGQKIVKIDGSLKEADVTRSIFDVLPPHLRHHAHAAE